MAVRRVRRILRRIDLVFNAIAALIFVLGMWVTWSLALRRGIPDRIVDIFESLTLTITIEGELYFRIVVLLAIIGAILMTAFMTLGALLYNLIADLVGGIEIAVLEETYRPVATRTRLTPAAADAPAVAQEIPTFAAAVPPEAMPIHEALPDRESPIPVPVVTQEPSTTDAEADEAATDDDGGPLLGEGGVSRVRAS
jgi:hypothetical protein